MGRTLRGVKEILRYIKETHGVRVSRTTFYERTNARGAKRFPAERKLVGSYCHLVADVRLVDVWVKRWYVPAVVGEQFGTESPTAAAL